MTLPALAVQGQGQGVISADNANSYLQGTLLASDLRAFPALSTMQVNVLGTAAADDGGAGVFYYDSSSTAGDDGVNVISPFGQVQGRWLRVLLNSSGAIITGPQSTLASAATTDLGSATSHLVLITGTTTITSLGTSASLSAPTYFLKFSGSLTLTASAALLIPGGKNITTEANDFAIVQYLGGGNWVLLAYIPASGGGASFSFADDADTAAGVSTNLSVTPAGLASVLQREAMTWGGADSSGTPNSILVNLTPALTAYTRGDTVSFILANSVTAGGVDININSVGAVAWKINGQDPTDNSMLSGLIYTGKYDGSVFQQQSVQNAEFFESSAVAIATPSNGSFSTGFTSNPRFVQGYLRNVTGEFGYLPGDEVPVYFGHDTGGNHGITTWISGGSVNYQMSASTILVYDTSGVNQNITDASWTYFARAWV